MAGGTGWLAVAALLALSVPGVAASDAKPLKVALYVDDRAGVPPGELATVRIEVERVFGAAGVEVSWPEGGLAAFVVSAHRASSEARHIAVMVINTTEETKPDAAGCPLGFAARRPDVAHAFYNRVAGLGATRPIDSSVVLGRVIAHEVGHVLLPTNSHSRYGIMRANLDLGAANPDRFTDEQVRLIHSALGSRSKP